MQTLFFVAFSIGILGSFHCVGMCGPLALSLPLRNDRFITKFSGALIYNAGRIVTYSLFGLLFGMIGQTAALFGFQQWLSIGVGAIILVFLIMPERFKLQSISSGYINKLFTRLRSALGRLFTQKSGSSLFVIGLLNGLLPCGLVYMAVAGAIATGDLGHSVMFMAAFGLGTLPVMWGIAFFGHYIGTALRQKVRRLYPYMMAVMASLLILRGLGLGIPYISPKMDLKSEQVKGCCNKDDKSQVLK